MLMLAAVVLAGDGKLIFLLVKKKAVKIGGKNS